jgi:hypothetical protein
MLTISLIKELYFIYLFKRKKDANYKLEVVFSSLYEFPLFVSIFNDRLTLTYKDKKIWDESLEEAVTMFGLESVQTIHHIIVLINQNNEYWLRIPHEFP